MEDNENNDIQEQQQNQMFNLLIELNKEGKITAEQFGEFKEKFNKLIETSLQTYQNHKYLVMKAKKLKNEVNLEKSKLEQATNKQMECQDIVEKLSSKMKNAERNAEIQEQRNEKLHMDFVQQDIEKTAKVIRQQDEEKMARDRNRPEINNNDNKLTDLENEIEKHKQKIEQEEKLIRDIKGRIKQEDGHKEDYLKEKDVLFEEKNRIFKIPDIIATKTKKQKKAISELKIFKEQAQEDIQKKEEVLKGQQEEIEKQSKILQEKQSEIIKEQEDLENMDEIKRQYQEEINKCREKYGDKAGERFRMETDHKQLFKDLRRRQDRINMINKQIDMEKKKFKKNENERAGLKEGIRELEISKEKYAKEEKGLLTDMEKQEENIGNIKQQNTLLEMKKLKTEGKTGDKEGEYTSYDKQIKELEKDVLELVSIEVQAQQSIKHLKTLRESMARKASSAMADVRETRQELKIKDLLILDLKKKQQETETKLNNYKALYEEVKSARNKYVNMIQNSSQDLAEMKERIKILGNELEILKNESSEKERSLQEYKLILQQEIHKRDGIKTSLNKRQYKSKQTYQQVDQNISEIEKLNMVIFALEKEMLGLKQKYEVACEDRNYAGVQLIDRNDELCILYEKNNIQQSVLTQGEAEIKRLEDEIRMVKLELQDTQRKISVSREKVLLVPQLADEVVQIKTALNLEKEKEKDLSQQLENPINQARWRELEGEDPEPEALEAKISILEERLNQKKETLLEKELILDEITTLSDKLRKQAIEGRQQTLSMAEKINTFQNRLKVITRKMMATISELSMFQATCLKLQNERDRLDETNREAEERVQTNNAPFIDTEIQYLKMVRDQKRHQEEMDIRKQREVLEKNIPPFATKTTAEHRFNCYIPDDIGISKPYGNHAPFKPSQFSANLRFIRKPEPKEIEI